MTNQELLDTIVCLNKALHHLYREEKTEKGFRPIIGVTEEYVQLDLPAFLEFFSTIGYTVKPIELSNFPYELWTVFKDVKFLSLATEKDLQK